MLLSSLDMWKRLMQTKVYKIFYYIWKERTHQSLKSCSCKKLFLQCVCNWYNLLRWMFFIPYEDSTVFHKVYCNTEVFSTGMLLLSLEEVFFEGSLYFTLSTQKQYNSNTKALKLSCRIFFLISSTNFILWLRLLLSFVLQLHLFLSWNLY